MHLDLDDTVALARFAAPAFDIETETARFVAANFGFLRLREQIANECEQAGVSRRIAARRAANRRLIDVDDLVEMLQAEQFFKRQWLRFGAVDLARQHAIQGLVDQRRFARTGNAGNHIENTERNFGAHFLEIVAARTNQFNIGTVSRAAFQRHWNIFAASEVRAGERFLILRHFLRRAGGNDMSATDAGGRPEINHPIRGFNGFVIVLDHDHGVAEIAQTHECVNELAIVALMQTNGRLVQNVKHADELRADLRR
ncbi:MAG: hypothetical protein ALAOOOJD_03029 [bacterium]|nr:hypothetical protein [bacterium]